MASNTTQFVQIDGSYLEGGGQILRITAPLSVLLKKPIQIKSIRAEKKDRGLKPQHLTGILLLSNISNAKLVGAQLKSLELSFLPEKLSPGLYLADTKTAGSICLIIQAALPCLLFTSKESELILRGGTNASDAPQIDYFQMAFVPMAQKFGINVNLDIIRRGFYPRGGGEVYLKVEPVKSLTSINITEFGKLKRIYGRVFVAHLPIKIAERMAFESKRLLKYIYGINLPVEIDIVKEPYHVNIDAGTGLILIAETTNGCLLAGSSLGKKEISSEKVAQEAVEQLRHNIDNESCVDSYMQDQLILFMALAKGKSSIRSGPLTLHTKTAIYFTELMTGVKFNVYSETENKNFIIECDGMGYESK